MLKIVIVNSQTQTHTGWGGHSYIRIHRHKHTSSFLFRQENNRSTTSHVMFFLSSLFFFFQCLLKWVPQHATIQANAMLQVSSFDWVVCAFHFLAIGGIPLATKYSSVLDFEKKEKVCTL